MSIFSGRQQPTEIAPIELPPSSDVARRESELKRDDIRSYVETGGDLSAWPSNNRWLDPHSDYFVPVADRPYYHRDRRDDLRHAEALIESLKRQGGERLTREQLDLYAHKAALADAQARRKQHETEVREAQRDRTERRCQRCGTEADHTVKPRAIGKWAHLDGWHLIANGAPRICAACFLVVEDEIDELRAQRAREAADEQTPNGRRGDICRGWVVDHEKELLP